MLAFVLVVAAIVRLDTIGPRTEFLGDQGVIATELYQAFHQGHLPETGLVHSNGIRSGPILYYLLAPSFFLSRANPIGMAIFMALLGVATVYLLFLLGEKLYGTAPAFLVAGLYAVSPLIATQSRAIWPPALLPFFSIVALCGLVLMDQKRNPAWLIIVSTACAVMSQMYIPALPSVLFFGISSLFVLVRLRKSNSAKTLLFWLVLAAVCFFIIWFPYLKYESAHAFEDIRAFILTTVFPAEPSSALASSIADRVSLVRSVFEKLLPLQSQLAALFGGILVVIALAVGTFWGRVLVFWYAVSSLPILVFKGPTFEHYAATLLPLPFLLLGFLLRRLFAYSRYLALSMGLFLLFLQLSTGSKVPIYNDLARTKSVVDEMVAQAKGRDFSFTLLSSRSFSDYHYRYFFLRKGITPRIIYEDKYPILFLVCEHSTCPSWDDLRKRGIIAVLCYEEFCNPSYPDKRLTGWMLAREVDIEGAHLLTLRMNAVQLP